MVRVCVFRLCIDIRGSSDNVVRATVPCVES